MTLKEIILTIFSILIITATIFLTTVGYIQKIKSRKNEAPSYSIEIKQRNRIKLNI